MGEDDLEQPVKVRERAKIADNADPEEEYLNWLIIRVVVDYLGRIP